MAFLASNAPDNATEALRPSSYQSIPLHEAEAPATVPSPWYKRPLSAEPSQDGWSAPSMPSSRRCFGLLDPLEAVAMAGKTKPGLGYQMNNLMTKQVMYEDLSAYTSVLTTIVWVLQNELVDTYGGPTAMTDALLWSILVLTLLTITFVAEASMSVYEMKTIRCPELQQLDLWQGSPPPFLLRNGQLDLL